MNQETQEKLEVLGVYLSKALEEKLDEKTYSILGAGIGTGLIGSLCGFLLLSLLSAGVSHIFNMLSTQEIRCSVRNIEDRYVVCRISGDGNIETTKAFEINNGIVLFNLEYSINSEEIIKVRHGEVIGVTTPSQ